MACRFIRERTVEWKYLFCHDGNLHLKNQGIMIEYIMIPSLSLIRCAPMLACLVIYKVTNLVYFKFLSGNVLGGL